MSMTLEKPVCKYAKEVIATNRGWEAVLHNGNTELLNSIKGLKDLLERQVDEVDETPEIDDVQETVIEESETVVEEPVESDEILDEYEELVEILEDDVETEVVEELYTAESLEDMKMGELREIGKKYGVKDNSKTDLITKILDEQSK